MSVRDAVITRVVSVRRCVAQARRYLDEAGLDFDTDLLRQDAAVLNVIRACDLCIDLANLWIRRERLGVPQESADSFRLLMRAGLLEQALGDRLQKMVGFRNLAVHQYHQLDLVIVRAVIEKNLDDPLAFSETVRVAWSKDSEPHA